MFIPSFVKGEQFGSRMVKISVTLSFIVGYQHLCLGLKESLTFLTQLVTHCICLYLHRSLLPVLFHILSSLHLFFHCSFIVLSTLTFHIDFPTAIVCRAWLSSPMPSISAPVTPVRTPVATPLASPAPTPPVPGPGLEDRISNVLLYHYRQLYDRYYKLTYIYIICIDYYRFIHIT